MGKNRSEMQEKIRVAQTSRITTLTMTEVGSWELNVVELER